MIHNPRNENGVFNIKLGFALLKSREVPVTSKILALGVGVALTGLLLLFEVPFEALVGLLIPFFGLGADVAIDGVEALFMPVVFACMVLPRITRSV